MLRVQLTITRACIGPLKPMQLVEITMAISNSHCTSYANPSIFSTLAIPRKGFDVLQQQNVSQVKSQKSETNSLFIFFFFCHKLQTLKCAKNPFWKFFFYDKKKALAAENILKIPVP